MRTTRIQIVNQVLLDTNLKFWEKQIRNKDKALYFFEISYPSSHGHVPNWQKQDFVELKERIQVSLKTDCLREDEHVVRHKDKLFEVFVLPVRTLVHI